MQKALPRLARRDRVIGQLYKEFGVPPLWKRPQTFATLVHIILEQKVSLASANAVMARVCQVCPGMRPQEFVQLPDAVLLSAGVSRGKLRYCKSAAQSLINNQLQLASLRQLSDQAVIEKLTAVKGIGPWSAGVYLMMALRRQDAWASGDRALVLSYQHSANLPDTPSYAALDEIAMQWSPDRATAARLLWHAYLERKKR